MRADGYTREIDTDSGILSLVFSEKYDHAALKCVASEYGQTCFWDGAGSMAKLNAEFFGLSCK